MRPSRLIPVEDHLRVYREIKQIPGKDPDMEVIGRGAKCQEAWHLL
jgi:hypothetical protein